MLKKIKTRKVSILMKIIKKLCKKLMLVGLGIYILCMFISQQQTLNRYKKEVKEYDVQIEEAEETKQSLLEMKENVNSPEYIEKIAREKLGMYLPNERVYIDIGK